MWVKLGLIISPDVQGATPYLPLQSGHYVTPDLAELRDRGLKRHGYRDWSLRDR